MGSQRDIGFAVLLLAGLVSLGNAFWMLADPMHWYHDLPAGVPDFGAFNEHFVRDIGCAFLAIGTALLWAAWRPALRAPLVTVSAVFLVAHAGLHVYDTARGYVESHHWWLDLPLVYAPAVVIGLFSLRLLRSAPEPSRP